MDLSIGWYLYNLLLNDETWVNKLEFEYDLGIEVNE